MSDEHAKPVLFDFSTKRKHFVDTLQEKLKRNIQKQNYSVITKMIPYKDYLVCLVRRHFQNNTIWKRFQKFIGSKKAEIEFVQKI